MTWMNWDERSCSEPCRQAGERRAFIPTTGPTGELGSGEQRWVCTIARTCEFRDGFETTTLVCAIYYIKCVPTVVRLNCELRACVIVLVCSVFCKLKCIPISVQIISRSPMRMELMCMRFVLDSDYRISKCAIRN